MGVRRTLHAAARTGPLRRALPGACGSPSDPGACPSATAARRRAVRGCGIFRPVTGFYIAGGVLAGWALLVSALGVMREDFPGSDGSARLVAAISILLVVAAVGSAIYLSATEEHEPKGEHAGAQ